MDTIAHESNEPHLCSRYPGGVAGTCSFLSVSPMNRRCRYCDRPDRPTADLEELLAGNPR